MRNKWLDMFDKDIGVELFTVLSTKVRVFILWYDFYIGFYYDTDDAILYIVPFPMLVFKIQKVAYG